MLFLSACFQKQGGDWGRKRSHFFPSFLKVYIQWERGDAAKTQRTLWDPFSDTYSGICSGIDFLLPATALSPKAKLHDRWNEWVGRNEESYIGGMSIHASGQSFKCKAIRWDYFQHREPWERHPLVTAQHRHLSFLPHPVPGTTYHIFCCLQHGASQGRPKTEVSWMMELLVSQKGSMKQQSNIQVLCRPQCTTDLSNTFQKCQTRAIPELPHVVVPLTCSLALYLCNLLSLSLLTAEMLKALPLCVVFKQTSFAALQD